MILTEFPKERAVFVCQHIIETDTRTDEHLLHLWNGPQFAQQGNIIAVIRTNILAWFREKALPVWTCALRQLLFAGRETEVCGRAAYIVDIALKVRFLCEKLCLFHQRFMASCLNDAPLMESQGTETAGAKAAAVADQAEFDLPDSRDAALRFVAWIAYQYWKETGDASVFDSEWIQAITNILKTFKEQQRKGRVDYYKFQRKTERALDTLNNNGLGAPVNPVGLIVSCFRPSDDATTLQFLVPSNFFAVSSLRKAAEILTTVNQNTNLAQQCTDLAEEVETALQKYATYNHPKYGTIYAFEVDGFGNHLLMDDANVPSLLAMAYLGDVDINDPIYQNTRRFVWSKDNPYFFKGKAGEGIGGPHIGYDMIWPMSIMMKAFTSQDDEEIKDCVKMLIDTDAGTGFIHESFHKDDPANFTRAWFAWQNTLFGELILKLVNEGKTDLLNSIQ